jgi:hypothetical protein
MTTYRGRLQISGAVDRSLEIHMDPDQESLAMRTPDGEEIGAWPQPRSSVLTSPGRIGLYLDRSLLHRCG